MNILGVSGLQNSVPFKQLHWPGLDPREYRISQGHDSAAVLVCDGSLMAASAEERFSRKKHTGDFPIGAISYCLSETGLTIDDVDEIAHGFDYSPYRELYSMDPVSAKLYCEVFSKEALVSQITRHFPGYPEERVHQINHHLAHAASAYFTSGWDKCLVIVIDAMGEAESVSIYRADAGRLALVRQISANDSIGILYSLVTLHLGFDFNSDEYKIMGLAPYGDPTRFRSFFEEVVELRNHGSIRIPILSMNKSRTERENYYATRNYLDKHLITRRPPEADITRDHQDVAAALQECLERVVTHICKYFGAATGIKHLALAGGVALNCTANGKLVRSGVFDEVYVQPAAGDDGSALGAALFRSARHSEVTNRRMPVPFFGPAASQEDIEKALTSFGRCIQVRRFETLADTCTEAANLIAAGKVIAWYRGRMEYGPRALGNRSILADPGHPEMRDRINSMVKMREAFRPFAPAVSIEQVDTWFDVPPGTELPYMITTVGVREQHRAALPAVTHVDGSARTQTVSASDNKAFHTLLQAAGRTTGREMVLNTSFNVKGQPIVNTPCEAIETFLRTGIEYLFLEDHLISRP